MMGLGEVGKITGVQRVGEKRKVETGRGVQWDSLLEREYGLKVMRPWGSTGTVWKALDSPPKPGSGPVLFRQHAALSWAKHFTSLNLGFYICR